MISQMSQHFGSKTNRHPKKQWFVTYPKWDSTRQAIIADYSNYDYYIVCQEQHKDGTLHYHICIKFVKPTKKQHILDMVKRTYPNDWKRVHIQPVRNIKATIEYCQKEDNEYITEGSVDTSTKFQRWYNQAFEEAFGISVKQNDDRINAEILKRLKIDFGDSESVSWMTKNFQKLKKSYNI